MLRMATVSAIELGRKEYPWPEWSTDKIIGDDFRVRVSGRFVTCEEQGEGPRLGSLGKLAHQCRPYKDCLN
jgi:hypothetical protein